MNNSLKPDLGIAFSKKFSKEITHNFYSVRCGDILHVGDNLYSFMSVSEFDGEEYAASFDFSGTMLNSLLIQLNDKEFTSYLKEVLLKPFIGQSSKAAFYGTPIKMDIIAKLGELVKSQHETFVPIVVTEFSNVVME